MAECNCRKRKREKEKIADDANTVFRKKPTLENLKIMCNAFLDYGEYQCADTLGDKGRKIPTSELKKIIEFIEDNGSKKGWENLELSVEAIISSHNKRGDWTTMSDERFECFRPYFDLDFWENLINDKQLRDPRGMSPDEFRMVMNTILADE